MRPYGPPLPTRQWPIWLRYLATIVLFGLVLLLQAVWYEAAQFPFLFFFSNIVLCAVLFNRGAWLLATALAAGAWQRQAQLDRLTPLLGRWNVEAHIAEPDFTPVYGGAVGELRLQRLPMLTH